MLGVAKWIKNPRKNQPMFKSIKKDECDFIHTRKFKLSEVAVDENGLMFDKYVPSLDGSFGEFVRCSLNEATHFNYELPFKKCDGSKFYARGIMPQLIHS